MRKADTTTVTRLPERAAWLNMFNADLFPKRYWRGPRSRDVGAGGGGGGCYTVSTRMTPALRFSPPWMLSNKVSQPF